ERIAQVVALLERPAIDVAADRVSRVPRRDHDLDRSPALEVRLRAEPGHRGDDLEAVGLEQPRQQIERLTIIVDDQGGRTSQRQGGADYSRASVSAYAMDASARRARRGFGLRGRWDQHGPGDPPAPFG